MHCLRALDVRAKPQTDSRGASVVGSQVSGKGVVFGNKLKSDAEIAMALGRYPQLAPGGSVRVESFAHDNKVQRRGVPFGVRLKSRREIEIKLGTRRTCSATTAKRALLWLLIQCFVVSCVVRTGYPERPGPGQYSLRDDRV